MRVGFGLALAVVLGLVPGVLRAQDAGRVRQREALDHYRQGESAFRREDLPGAEREFKAALALDPGMVLAHFALGQTYMAGKRYPDAVDSLTRAKRAVVEENQLLSSGSSAAEQARVDEIQQLRDSLRTIDNPSAVKEPDMLMRSRIEERIRLLETQSSRSNTPPEVPAEFSFALGTALLRLGNSPAAEKEYREAVRVKPGYGEAHNNLAVVIAMQGRWAEAAAEIALAEKAGFKVPANLKSDVEAGRFSPAATTARLAPATQAFTVSHQPVGCVVAGGHPRIEATIIPADSVSRARVRFRTAKASDWYTVAMEREGDVFAAVLPRPRKDLDAFQYQVEATDIAINTRRTDELTALVKLRPEDCAGTRLADYTATSTALVDAPAGAAALPPGFDAALRPKRAGSSGKAGVLHMGPYASLAASAGVLAGAGYVGLKVSNRDETVVAVTFAGSDPPPGSLVVGVNTMVTARFSVEAHETFEGKLVAGLIQQGGFQTCAILTSATTSFRKGQTTEVPASGPTGGCVSLGHTEFAIVRILDETNRTVFTTVGDTSNQGGGQPPFELPMRFALTQP